MRIPQFKASFIQKSTHCVTKLAKSTQLGWTAVATVATVAAGVVLSGLILQPQKAHAFAADRDYSYRKAGANQMLQVTSLGDSIAAGYCGVGCMAMDSYVNYFGYRAPGSIAQSLNTSIAGKQHAVSGYTSGEILKRMDYINQDQDTGIIYMNVPQDLREADFITIDACGNDFLRGRSYFKSECNEGRLHAAVESCKTNIQAIFERALQLGKPGVRIRVMNLYYPGMNEDAQGQCNGKNNVEPILDALAESNYYTCEYARRLGIPCADAFSVMNSADEDRAKVSWIAGESLESYKQRITITARPLVTDPTQKKTAQGVINLLQSDQTHPTAEGHYRIGLAHAELGMLPTK